ncbi:MAG: hypothetical protein NC217_05365 [Muribaculaceae bacterium]|nr:hypothetical protein [Muribaculaceae bacterium]
MKKFLLSAILLAGGLTTSFANTNVIWFTAEKIGEEYDLMGQVYAMSDNGEYAIITDDEMNLCYRWSRSEPQKVSRINWAIDGRIIPLEIRGVADDGTITGSYRPYQSNSWKPYVQTPDGERIDLPVPPQTKNMNYPCAISADASIIGGYIGTGQMHPIIWQKDAQGEYQMHYNNELRLPHQGFAVNCMYTDGTLEGTYLGGTLYCGTASTIPAIYNNGQLIMWNELHSERVPWFYKGEVYGYETAAFIDSKRDLYFDPEDYINASFYCADRFGNFYGTRMIVGQSASDDPENENYGLTTATDKYMWGRYDTKTGQWEDAEGYSRISCALSEQIFFVDRDIYRNGLDGGHESLETVLDYSNAGRNVMGVSRTSADGRVMGLTYQATDVMGVPHVYPFMLLLDEPLLSGIDDIAADPDNGQVVLVSGGNITVVGASQVNVYDLNGVEVGSSNLPAGIYIVVADGISHKVKV